MQKSHLSVTHSRKKKVKSESMDIFLVNIFLMSSFAISNLNQFLQFLGSACFN